MARATNAIHCNLAAAVSRRLEAAYALETHGIKSAKVYADMAKEDFIKLGNELGFDVIGKEKPE